MSNNKPASKTYKLGVQLTGWDHEYNNKPFRTYTIQRRYKNKKGEWNNGSFSLGDLKNLQGMITEVLEAEEAK